MFVTGRSYSKKDIYNLLNVPVSQQKGIWNTGYASFKNNIYIFCNIGIAGTTGHDYDNRWDDDDLIWYAKTNAKISHPLIKLLLDPVTQIFIFTRTNSSSPFTFEGVGIAKDFKDLIPVQITWSFKEQSFNHPIILPEEVNSLLLDGGTVTITVNKYERSRAARQECIEFYGCFCQVCKFDFEKFYGEAGKEIIHVHHLKPLSEIKEKYVINPVTDLIPVCPNCHALMHRKNPCYTMMEIKDFILRVNYSN